MRYCICAPTVKRLLMTWPAPTSIHGSSSKTRAKTIELHRACKRRTGSPTAIDPRLLINGARGHKSAAPRRGGRAGWPPAAVVRYASGRSPQKRCWSRPARSGRAGGHREAVGAGSDRARPARPILSCPYPSPRPLCTIRRRHEPYAIPARMQNTCSPSARHVPPPADFTIADVCLSK